MYDTLHQCLFQVKKETVHIITHTCSIDSIEYTCRSWRRMRHWTNHNGHSYNER